ncbi:MAG TPA: nitroreductase family protein [Acidimicrobiales bacterium]|jgi:nitroreductase|nr:nitroreductase family protein [Acidimicrobiales bacterium]
MTTPTSPVSAAGFDLAETDRLLTTTRAVRKRLDLERPVERQVVLDCLRVATQAPSGGNTQPWRWLVVDDPEVRAGLADIYRAGYGPYIEMQKAAVVAAGGDENNAILRSSDYLAEHLHEVPVHVIPCLLSRLPERPTTADTAGFYGSILPAVWSFMLALRSRGLGSAYTTLHLQHEREAAELLGVPDTVTMVALLPVAHVSGDFRPADRKPIENVTYWNAWKRRA